MSNSKDNTAIPTTGAPVMPQDKYQSFIDQAGEFDVTCYQVTDGDNRILTQLLETKEQAIKIRDDLKTDYPNAKASRLDWYYSSINERGRLEMIASISKA